MSVKLILRDENLKTPKDAEFSQKLADNILLFWGAGHNIDICISPQTLNRDSRSSNGKTVYGIRSNMVNGRPV